MMAYKGYSGHAEFDDEADLFHGEVLAIRDVITFQGRTVDELRQAFRDSVDDYLEYCQKIGKTPDKPFSGKFVVRIKPDIHRQAAIAAQKAGQSLNSWVSETIEKAAVKL